MRGTNPLCSACLALSGRLRGAVVTSAKCPSGWLGLVWADRMDGFVRTKKIPGDTYFRACGHYHRLGKLNGRVRDGNGCFLSDMVTGKKPLGRSDPKRLG